MPIPGTQQVTAKIAPSSTLDTYATHDSIYGKGGRMEVADNTERDNITTERRSHGMVVFVKNTGVNWQLDSDLVTWNLYPSTLNGEAASYYLDRTNHTGTQAISTITGLQTALDNKIDDSEKGAPLGVVPLNASGQIDAAYLNIAPVTNYVNSWNATTNIPALADGVGTTGDAYIVAVGGNRDLGSGVIAFVAGASVIYNGTIWQQIVPAASGITSVNGQLGPAVNLTTNDVPTSTDKNYVTDDVMDAANAADAPSALNEFITDSALGTALSPIQADITAVEGDILTLQGDLTTLDGATLKVADLGTVGNPPPLNAFGKIDNSYLNFSLVNYVNTWNATTNTPTLINGTGTAGDGYVVGTAGTQNLGAGAITFAVGDHVIYNGAQWQKISPAGAGVVTWNGQSGVVTATADNVPETATRFYQTANQNAAADAAELAGASAGNRYALMTDLNIIVGGTFVMPENFSDGQTLGDGTVRTLSSLGYTNGTAAVAFPRTHAVYPMNVTSMDIDWVAWQELALFQTQSGATGIICPGSRKSYRPTRSIILPKTMVTAFPDERNRPRVIKYDFNGANFWDGSAAGIRIFDRYPTNQAEANSEMLSYGFVFMNGTFVGRTIVGLPDLNTSAIRIGACSHSSFTNLSVRNFDVNLDVQFGLETSMTNIFTGYHRTYGIRLGDGLWSGAGTDIAQSNNNILDQIHCYNAQFATPTANIYLSGNRNTVIRQATMEGYVGVQHAIFYDNLGASTTKNCLTIHDIDFEQGGASRAGIRMKSNAGQLKIFGFNNQCNTTEMPVMVEAEGGLNAIHVYITGGDFNGHTGWKFRNIPNFNGTPAAGATWTIDEVLLNDNANARGATNWDTTLGGTIPANGYVRFTPVLFQ